MWAQVTNQLEGEAKRAYYFWIELVNEAEKARREGRSMTDEARTFCEAVIIKEAQRGSFLSSMDVHIDFGNHGYACDSLHLGGAIYLAVASALTGWRMNEGVCTVRIRLHCEVSRSAEPRCL